eukprot:m.237174 g.237174  ORF g.237174 m.237174 type:complete len:469 (-) comp26557_c0_seq3:38-1444(-)
MTIIASSGAITFLSDAFTYLVVGTITNVDPSVGQVGTLVTLTGTELLGSGSSVQSVRLSGSSATVMSASDTTVVVQAASSSNPGAGDVEIVSNTGAIVTLSNGFTYTEESDITSVSPSSGQEGTRVTIGGARLRGAGNNVVTVTLASVPATIDSESDSQVIVVADDAASQTGDVVLTADTGATVTKANGWTYNAEGDVTSVVPAEGQVGTQVVIGGTNLLGSGSSLTQVTLGGVAVQSIDSESNTAVQVTAADNGGSSSSAGDIVLVADTGAVVTEPSGWTYLAVGTIARVEPARGHFGTVVDITGSGLLGGGNTVVSVTLGSTEVDNIVWSNNTLVRVRVAAASAGVVDVVLTSDTGAVVSLSAGFEYVAPAVIDLVSPNQGQLGTFVTIYGTGLFGGGNSIFSITLNGIQPLSIESESDSQVVLRAGQSDILGVGDIVIESDTGAIVELVGGWTYDIPSNITSVCA